MVFMLGELNVQELSQFLNKLNKGLHVANQANLMLKQVFVV